MPTILQSSLICKDIIKITKVKPLKMDFKFVLHQ
jgi:hypothetical protein